ncbi:MAG: hypothetical protein HC774_03290 [Sphingomonadales bacterium]|nr:hypothetical protein [Sphingomonadales bacterium]
MSQRTFALAFQLQQAQSEDEIWAVSARWLADLGISHSIYLFVHPQDPSRTKAWTQLPASWQSHYIEQGYSRKDPFLHYCCQEFVPVRTGPDYLADYSYLTAEERLIIQEGGETGFRSGFAAPVRLATANGEGFGGWNFGTAIPREEFESLFRDRGESIWLGAFFIHEHLQRLAKRDGVASTKGRLSARERDCLLWLSKGLRTDAIADRLGIARITVDLHFRNARIKLGAATREECLVKAILLREVEP